MTPLLTPEQVATLLAIPVALVEKFADTGRLSFYQIGSLEDGYQRFSEKHVQDFLDDNEHRCGAKETPVGETPTPDPQPQRKPPKHLVLDDDPE